MSLDAKIALQEDIKEGRVAINIINYQYTTFSFFLSLCRKRNKRHGAHRSGLRAKLPSNDLLTETLFRPSLAKMTSSKTEEGTAIPGCRTKKWPIISREVWKDLAEAPRSWPFGRVRRNVNSAMNSPGILKFRNHRNFALRDVIPNRDYSNSACARRRSRGSFGSRRSKLADRCAWLCLVVSFMSAG